MRVIIEATKEMIFGAQKSTEWCIVDARSSDAYIGWKKAGEIGGHIPYAKLFSADWLRNIQEDEQKYREECLKLELEAQMITSDKKVVVYDENGEDAELVCDYLSQKGIKSLFYYNLKNWDGDLYKYPNHKLTAPVWLIKDIVDGKIEQYGLDPDYKIFEIAWKEPSEQYLKTHIPGAIHIDSDEYEVDPQWVMADDEALLEFAKANGITPSTTVIVYGNNRLNVGAAAKLSAVLRYIGIKNVMWMNGTIRNWIEAGYPTESGNNEKVPCDIEKTQYVFDKVHAIHLDEAKEILADQQKGVLVDTRSWRCFIGEYSGYEDFDRAGRIPGALWCYYPNFFLTPTNQVGNLEVMLNVLETKGIDLNKTAAFFCGSAAWGAAITKILCNIAGYEKATIYEGGWCEWSEYPENPYETGIPEEYKDYDPEKFQVSKYMSAESCHVM